VAGLLLFARGFLLTRVELKGESGCDDAAHLTPRREPRAEGAGCWAEAPVRKVVVLIIDGLRWDIAASQARSAVQGRSLALPTLSALARERGAALLPFIADPPTTTQQRLKGLLTGASRLP
jgi:phosphatidylinositol glycan class O